MNKNSSVRFDMLIIEWPTNGLTFLDGCTVGPRLSGLFDYPDFFSCPVFFMNINKLWSQKLSEVKNCLKSSNVFKTAHLPLRFQKI